MLSIVRLQAEKFSAACWLSACIYLCEVLFYSLLLLLYIIAASKEPLLLQLLLKYVGYEPLLLSL